MATASGDKSVALMGSIQECHREGDAGDILGLSRLVAGTMTSDPRFLAFVTGVQQL
jgi:hypothetical protein